MPGSSNKFFPSGFQTKILYVLLKSPTGLPRASSEHCENIFQAPPAMEDQLKTKSERMTLSCRVSWVWSERVNLYSRQIMILLRKAKTFAISSDSPPSHWQWAPKFVICSVKLMILCIIYYYVVNRTNHAGFQCAVFYSLHLLSLKTKYSPQHFLLRHPQSIFFR
jgi:hypothetical protein